MSRKRRIIRKIHPKAQQGFGEQMWPLVVAMFVLGGFLAGTVLAYLRLDAPYWYANGWTWLIAIPLIIGGALVTLAYTGNRLLRRTMQLAIVICAIIHLTLFIVAIETDVFYRAWMEIVAETPQIQQRQAVTVPVYSPLQHDPQEYAASDYEQPVVAELPDPAAATVQREELEHRPDTDAPQPIVEPEPLVRPNLVRRSDPSRVEPRAEQQTSQLSRKTSEVPVEPNQRIELPTFEVRPTEQARVTPTETTAGRSSPAPTLPDPPTSRPLPDAADPDVPLQLARKTTESAPTPESESAPSFARRLSQPASLPRLDVPSDTPPSVARRTQPDALRPGNTLTRRRQTRAPDVARSNLQAVPEIATRITSRQQFRQRTMDAQPNLAQAQTTIDRQQPKLTTRPALPTTAVETAAPRAASSPTSAISASDTAVERQATESRPVTDNIDRTVPDPSVTALTNPATTRSGPAARRVPAIAALPDTPSPSPTRAAAAVTPTMAAAEQAAGPRAASGPPRPSPAAAALALTKSNSGVAGSGASRNLGQAQPAADKPASVASGSARRARDSQTMPPGPALSPQEAVMVRNQRAGQARPNAVLRATQLDRAAEPGNREPSDLLASSSAALERSASDAATGPVTATKGPLDVDVGPTTIVSAAGSGKAAGGGQPRISSGGDQQIARQQPAGISLQMSPTPVAPAANVSASASGASAAGSAALTAADTGLNAAARSSGTEATVASASAPSPAADAETVSATAVAARAEAARAEPGPEQAGGGNEMPDKTASGPQLRTNSLAQQVEVAGIEASSGAAEASPSFADGRSPRPRSGGAPLPIEPGPIGTLPSDLLAAAPPRTRPGSGSMSREASPTEQQGPAVADLAQTGGLGKRPTELTPPGSSVPLAIPNVAGRSTESPDDGAAVAANLEAAGDADRRSSSSLPVEIAAEPGPGGLDQEMTPRIGLPRRRSDALSPRMQLDTFRFTRSDLGGLPDLSATAAMAAAPYRHRAERGSGMGRTESSPGPQTEEAIELGLVFLSRAQSADGAWRLDHFAAQDGLPQMASDTAATGLALLAFQGAGYHHRSRRYGTEVGRGIEFLVQNQQEDGCLFTPTDPASNRVVLFYSHGIAALALSEAFGMTQDPALREPAQKALDYIIETQNKQRGGWRYTPQIGSDTSVTGWMVMALKSGELADLNVPASTYSGIRSWLDRARASESEPYLFCYNPYAPDTPSQRQGRRPTTTMTSVGLLMQLYLGWRRDHPWMSQGADVLRKSLPAVGTPTNPQRDTYYWYYATQVMFHMGGQYWEAWNSRLHPLLINTQIRDGEMAGSWDPSLPVPDRWAPHAGRLYVTTLNLLSLEVTYRYLPLYEDTAR